MTNFLALILFLMVPVAVPWWFYNCKRTFMIRFYLAMAASEKVRKFYISIWFIMLLLFHYMYMKVMPGEFGVLISTIPCLLLFSYSWTDRIFRIIHERLKVVVIMTIVAVAMVAVPHLYTLSITIAYFMTAALFYPSSKILSEYYKYRNRESWKNQANEIIGCYHCFHHAIGHECADSGKDNETHNNQLQILENNEE